MRRLLVPLFLVLSLVTPRLEASPEKLSFFHDQLGEISDQSLRRTIENSILSGLIETQHDFDSVVSNAEMSANNDSPTYYSAREGNSNIGKIRDRISELCEPLTELDRDALEVDKTSDFKSGNSKELFCDIKGDIPASYKTALDFCYKFNPVSGTNDHKRLNKDIDAYLKSIENDPVIKHALSSTNSTMADFKKNWFGSGLGFEHVIVGEVKGSKVSGYHWWYKFYADERNGFAQVKTIINGQGNPRIYTGSFNWDPDGDGPIRNARKPKGGFINGSSCSAMLALGHIAMEVAKDYGKVPGALKFRADVNGEEFDWQLYTMGGNIRSLYPMSNGKTYVNPDGEDKDYYEHQNGGRESVEVEGNNTIN